MQNVEFGNRLCELRKAAGLSQTQLGEKLHVTNKAVSKWENGKSMPGLNIVRTLADALNVTVDELLPEQSRKKKITKIVITGGPCAGKTTAMSWIQNAFARMGYAVLFVDETATQLITGGAAPWLSTSNRDYQWRLIELQQSKEKAFTEIAKTMKDEKILVVCDRAALDNRAYMTESDFQYVLRQLNTNEVALRDQYDGRIVAKGWRRLRRFQNVTVNGCYPAVTVEKDGSSIQSVLVCWGNHEEILAAKANRRK